MGVRVPSLSPGVPPPTDRYGDDDGDAMCAYEHPCFVHGIVSYHMNSIFLPYTYIVVLCSPGTHSSYPARWKGFLVSGPCPGTQQPGIKSGMAGGAACSQERGHVVHFRANSPPSSPLSSRTLGVSDAAERACMCASVHKDREPPPGFVPLLLPDTVVRSTVRSTVELL